MDMALDAHPCSRVLPEYVMMMIPVFQPPHVPQSSVPAMKTGRRRAFIDVGLTVEPCEAIGTQAKVAIDPVQAFPAILAWLRYALVDVGVALRP